MLGFSRIGFHPTTGKSRYSKHLLFYKSNGAFHVFTNVKNLYYSTKSMRYSRPINYEEIKE